MAESVIGSILAAETRSEPASPEVPSEFKASLLKSVGNIIAEQVPASLRTEEITHEGVGPISRQKVRYVLPPLLRGEAVDRSTIRADDVEEVPSTQERTHRADAVTYVVLSKVGPEDVLSKKKAEVLAAVLTSMQGLIGVNRERLEAPDGTPISIKQGRVALLTVLEGALGQFDISRAAIEDPAAISAALQAYSDQLLWPVNAGLQLEPNDVALGQEISKGKVNAEVNSLPGVVVPICINYFPPDAPESYIRVTSIGGLPQAHHERKKS